MSDFWAAHEEREVEHEAAKVERLRAERETAILARIPDAADRMCCTLRSSIEVCDEGACRVLAFTLG